MLLVLDPSSTCVGYAVFDEGNNLVEAGRLLPSPSSGPANQRILSLAAQVAQLYDELPRGRVLLEDTSGHVGRRRHGGGGAGLATYGKALGFIWAKLAGVGADVVLVTENRWTRGMPKAHRILVMAQRHRGRYRPENDPGGDVADAIYLGEWWITEQTLLTLKEKR